MNGNFAYLEQPLEARTRRRGSSNEISSPARSERRATVTFDALDTHFEERDKAIEQFRRKISLLCRPSIFQTLELSTSDELINAIAAFHQVFTRQPEDATYKELRVWARAQLASAYENYLHTARTNARPKIRELQANLEDVSDLVSDGWYASAVRRQLELKTS